jgi:hypothetical protein
MGRGCFLERLNGSPVVFLAFVLRETASPECNGGECRGGRNPPRAKALENKGLKYESEKKYPLPINGYPYGKGQKTCGSRLKV